MRKRRAAAAAITTLLCLLTAVPAVGHEGDSNFRSEIDAVHPRVPGVAFQVLNYDADMEAVVGDGHTLLIYGYEGEPFARILGDGTVQKNQRSPATYLNVDRYAESPVPEEADPEAPPRWETVDRSGVLRWHDHRMHYMAAGTPPQVRDESERSKVFEYAIPLRIDGRGGAIEGTLTWVGPAEASKLPFLLAGVAVVVLAGVAVLVVRRRRGDGDERGDGEAW